MDFIKKAGDAIKGSGSNNQAAGGAPPQGGAAPAAGAGTQDYGDKVFDAVSKKSGHDFAPGTDEKITDGARGLYEKATGSKVDPKYSN